MNPLRKINQVFRRDQEDERPHAERCGEKESLYFRDIHIEKRNVDEEARTVELAFASDAPIERWGDTEILSHEEGAIELERLERKAPFLMDHNRMDQRGVVVEGSFSNDGHISRCTVRIAKHARGQELLDDIVDEQRTLVSVGYIVHEWKYNEDERTWTALRWEPIEISSVAIPADITVGTGRSDGPREEKPKGVDRSKTDHSVEDETNENPSENLRNEDMTPEEKAEVERKEQERQQAESQRLQQEATEAAQTSERERIADINKLAREHSAPTELVDKAIKEGTSLDAFGRQLLEAQQQEEPDEIRSIKGAPSVNLGKGSEYNLARAIGFAVDKQAADGIEGEAHQEIMRGRTALNIDRSVRGTLVPFGALAAIDPRVRKMAKGNPELQRAITAAGGSVGSLVQDTVLAEMYIETLSSGSLLGELGVQILPGLAGDQTIPRGLTRNGMTWEDPDSVSDLPAKTGMTTGSIALTHRVAVGLYQMSRKALRNATPAVQGLMAQDLNIVAGEVLTDAVLEGSGSSNQPTGINSATGVGEVVITATSGQLNLTHDLLAEFDELLEEANAQNFGEACFVMTPTDVRKGRTTKLDDGSGLFLISREDGKRVTSTGVKVISRAGMGTNALYHGVFNQALVGLFGNGLELRMDSTPGHAGEDLYAFLDADVALRHAAAFNKRTAS